jgi:ATP-dependent DNA helicase RecQ
MDTGGPNAKEYETLKTVFGYNNFRLGQDEIIANILVKNDVCGVLATGVGKSLCYQFPAVHLNKTAVVISPLISLMKDQRMSLEAKNISCVVLSGGMVNYFQVMKDIIAGKYLVVYTTPEHLNGNTGFLSQLEKNDKLALLAIDEAHCISQWGHDFRPSFRMLSDIKRQIPKTPILALTATATPNVIKDMCETLKLNDPVLVKTGVRRANLILDVRLKSSNGRHDEDQCVLRDLTDVLTNPLESTIIYVLRKRDAEEICKMLQLAGYNAKYYHAGMPDNERLEVHEDFIYDRCPIVVATIAFGMGIDKPCIRKIVVWGLPANIATYYQEIGRAGRDGLESNCVLFYSPADIHIHRFLIGKMEEEQVRDHQLFLLEQMRKWAENNTVCHQVLLDYYFEHEQLLSNINVTEYVDCGKCDNCIFKMHKNACNEEELEINIGPEAHLLIDLVCSLAPKRYGLKNLINILMGSNSKDLQVALRNNPFYNKGSRHNTLWWKALSTYLFDNEYLQYHKMGGLYAKRTHSNATHVIQLVGTGSKILDTPDLYITPSLSQKILIPVEKKFSIHSKVDSMRDEGNELYTRLKQFRTNISTHMKLPPYVVLPDVILHSLMKLDLPTNIPRLTLINGLNTRLLLEYGEELLAVLNDIKTVKTETVVIEKVLTSTKLNESQMQTLKLIQSGKSLSDIGKSRGLIGATMENHFMKIVEHVPDFDYSPFVNETHIEIASEWINNNPTNLSQLKPIKDALDKSISYLEIKVALAIYKRNNITV